MLEKRATVHRPIGHGGLLVEMTGGGNGAKLAATRDARPAMHTVGGQSDVERLHRVAVKHARDAFGDDAALDRQWRNLGYLARPDIVAATSAGSTSAPWPSVEATGPTTRESASCVISSGTAWTRSSSCPCPTGTARRTCSISCPSSALWTATC